MESNLILRMQGMGCDIAASDPEVEVAILFETEELHRTITVACSSSAASLHGQFHVALRFLLHGSCVRCKFWTVCHASALSKCHDRCSCNLSS